MTAPLVFMDTETTGLSLDDDIWEFAAIRREPDGEQTELHLFIEHDRKKCARLPESFRTDHYDRYRDHHEVRQYEAARQIDALVGDNWPHIVGAVPNFDTERVALLLRAQGFWPGWHYHLIDVENLAVGCIAGRMVLDVDVDKVTPPWDSNELSRAVGINPDRFERHTAMGDVRWAMAIYDAVMGGTA